jgi:hypothetical protein
MSKIQLDEELLETVPVAAGVAVFRCTNPGCGHPHLLLLDKHNEPIAQFVVPDAPAFVAELLAMESGDVH